MNEKYKIPYMHACIRAFAQRYHLSVKSAFLYLRNFKGINFLNDFYDIEHLSSMEDTVDDLVCLCKKNGGQIA